MRMGSTAARERASPVKTAYLVLYNGVQAAGWAACLVALARAAGSSSQQQGAEQLHVHMYQEAGWLAREDGDRGWATHATGSDRAGADAMERVLGCARRHLAVGVLPRGHTRSHW